eukprot:scaffold96258_cov22-Prasinocladus_malaysianus.AAC.1
MVMYDRFLVSLRQLPKLIWSADWKMLGKLMSADRSRLSFCGLSEYRTEIFVLISWLLRSFLYIGSKPTYVERGQGLLSTMATT